MRIVGGVFGDARVKTVGVILWVLTMEQILLSLPISDSTHHILPERAYRVLRGMGGVYAPPLPGVVKGMVWRQAPRYT